MKKTLLLLITVFSLNLLADDHFETKEFIISDKTINSTIKLNSITVRCSMIGYGVEKLKVSVPDLEWEVLLDHLNFGKNEPCMTSGACSFSPGAEVHPDVASILNINKLTEDIEIQIILVEKYSINHKNKSCNRILEESLLSKVRSKTFTHSRSISFGDYPYKLCIQI